MLIDIRAVPQVDRESIIRGTGIGELRLAVVEQSGVHYTPLARIKGVHGQKRTVKARRNNVGIM